MTTKNDHEGGDNLRHMRSMRRRAGFRRLTRDEVAGLAALTNSARRLKKVHPKQDMRAALRLITHLRREWARTLERDELLSRITTDPAVCHGHPVLFGTRVRVWVILDALLDSDLPDILRRYPVLSYNDIRAALAFASESAQSGVRV